MNIPNNLGKSSLLAAVVFWTIIGADNFDRDAILYVFLSFIPIFLCVAVVILFTICPFFWWKEKPDFSKKQVFKTFYPYYAIVAFAISAYYTMTSGFDVNVIAFFSSVFVTTNQSWFWFAKENKTL